MPAVYIHTLGCPKNEVDSRKLSLELGRRGIITVGSPDSADVIVINTCGFIQAAKEESLEAIFEAASSFADRPLVVVGCLVERYRSELAEGIPEVAAWFGVRELESAAETIATLAAQDYEASRVEPNVAQPRVQPEACLGLPGAWGYVKISDGCSHKCSFCAIPSIKGPYEAESLDSIRAQADFLLANGARELVLVGQDTASWQHEDLDLAGLLEVLASDNRVGWLRVMYLHPTHVTDRLLKTMAAIPKVCAYLDLPFQHASRRVLRSMNRGGDGREFLALLERARATIPDVSLRSTFIVGFPGETEADFRELVNFCRQAQFDHAGFFVFSPEEGTKAAELGGRVPRSVIRRRSTLLSRVLLDASSRRLARKLGQQVTVLVDTTSVTDGPEGVIGVGRTQGQAPEVDGVTYLVGAGEQVEPGRFVRAKVVDILGYDLVAEVTE